MAIGLPSGLSEHAELGPDWVDWLARLPRLFADVLEEWELARDGNDLWHGSCSLVAPVVAPAGEPAVLKLSFDRDDESQHEALALQHWHANGTVRLLRADPRRRAVLLERLSRRDLTDVWDLEACEVVAGLYQRIHRPALPQLRTVTSYVEQWLDGLAYLPVDAPIPRRFVEQALSVGRDLVVDPASVGKIIHGDLHYENVLAGDREPWLIIDPKPMSGDPHYELAPMLWNRWDELAGDVRGGILRRFSTLVEVAGLDEARARDWVVVRSILNASSALYDAVKANHSVTPPDRKRITRCVTISKAMQG